MQNQYDHSYNYFYRTSKGVPRQHGIFAPGIDRFILIDDYDFWLTLETAEILSAKLPTLVYLLPPMDFELDNNNCIDYTIFNKTQQKIVASSIATARQQPIIKFLYDTDHITYAGIPEDFNNANREPMLAKLQGFAQFIHRHVMAINLTEVFYNSADTQTFTKKLIPPAWREGMQSRADRSALPQGIFSELRAVLYTANTAEDASQQIIELWRNHSADQGFMILGYYKILNQPLPVELEFARNSKPSSLSTFLF